MMMSNSASRFSCTFAALGRSLEDLVVDRAQQGGKDVGLGSELLAQVAQRHAGRLGDVEQGHVGPALPGGTGERRGGMRPLVVVASNMGRCLLLLPSTLGKAERNQLRRLGSGLTHYRRLIVGQFQF